MDIIWIRKRRLWDVRQYVLCQYIPEALDSCYLLICDRLLCVGSSGGLLLERAQEKQEDCVSDCRDCWSISPFQGQRRSSWPASVIKMPVRRQHPVRNQWCEWLSLYLNIYFSFVVCCFCRV